MCPLSLTLVLPVINQRHVIVLSLFMSALYCITVLQGNISLVYTLLAFMCAHLFTISGSDAFVLQHVPLKCVAFAVHGNCFSCTFLCNIIDLLFPALL